MIREVTRGNWTAEDYLWLDMETIACDLEIACLKGNLAEYLKDWKVERVLRYKDEIANVILSIRLGDHFIQIVTCCRMISGIDLKYLDCKLANAKIEGWICEAINEIYR